MSHPFSTSFWNCCTRPGKPPSHTATLVPEKQQPPEQYHSGPLALSEAEDASGFHRNEAIALKLQTHLTGQGMEQQRRPAPSSINFIPFHRNTGQGTQSEVTNCAKLSTVKPFKVSWKTLVFLACPAASGHNASGFYPLQPIAFQR